MSGQSTLTLESFPQAMSFVSNGVDAYKELTELIRPYYQDLTPDHQRDFDALSGKFIRLLSSFGSFLNFVHASITNLKRKVQSPGIHALGGTFAPYMQASVFHQLLRDSSSLQQACHALVTDMNRSKDTYDTNWLGKCLAIVGCIIGCVIVCLAVPPLLAAAGLAAGVGVGVTAGQMLFIAGGLGAVGGAIIGAGAVGVYLSASKIEQVEKVIEHVKFIQNKSAQLEDHLSQLELHVGRELLGKEFIIEDCDAILTEIGACKKFVQDLRK